jgi:hypothetical protein
VSGADDDDHYDDLPCRLWFVEFEHVQGLPCGMDDDECWGYPEYVARVHRAVL